MAAVHPPVAKDFDVKLSTGEWRVVVRVPNGLTVYRPTMLIGGSEADTVERLDTFIHEGLHASNHKLSEADVTRMADDISTILWKAGYRRCV